MGWLVWVEWDEWQTYDEVSKKVEELERLEAELKIPEYITSLDKLTRVKLFLSQIVKHPIIGPTVQAEWKKFITPSPQLTDDHR